MIIMMVIVLMVMIIINCDGDDDGGGGGDGGDGGDDDDDGDGDGDGMVMIITTVMIIRMVMIIYITMVMTMMIIMMMIMIMIMMGWVSIVSHDDHGAYFAFLSIASMVLIVFTFKESKPCNMDLPLFRKATKTTHLIPSCEPRHALWPVPVPWPLRCRAWGFGESS